MPHATVALMRPTVHALSPAKLNLALSVGRPQASGMHPISSWMVTVDLHDELFVDGRHRL